MVNNLLLYGGMGLVVFLGWVLPGVSDTEIQNVIITNNLTGGRIAVGPYLYDNETHKFFNESELNTTILEVAPGGSGSGKEGSNPWLYNDSNTMYWNESQGNLTYTPLTTFLNENTSIWNELGNVADTNESGRFYNLTSTDCGGTDKVVGVDNNGSVKCAEDIDTDYDTTYTASGTLLDLSGTVFSVNEGTLTDTKLCKYTSGTGLECNVEPVTDTWNTTEDFADDFVNRTTNDILIGNYTFEGSIILGEGSEAGEKILLVNNTGSATEPVYFQHANKHIWFGEVIPTYFGIYARPEMFFSSWNAVSYYAVQDNGVTIVNGDTGIFIGQGNDYVEFSYEVNVKGEFTAESTSLFEGNANFTNHNITDVNCIYMGNFSQCYNSSDNKMYIKIVT